MSITAIFGTSFLLVTDDAWALRELDFDKDGIFDEFDECPQRPETYNQFQDKDGCPDSLVDEKTKYEFPDSDGDGIEDRLDNCVDIPENINGYLDHDGCPEIPAEKSELILDSDSDSVPDSMDACPGQPETFNGFKDADGCPDSAETTVSIPSTPTTSQCRDDKVEVLRFSPKRTVCVFLDTAKKWEQYGIAEIISLPAPKKEIPTQPEIPSIPQLPEREKFSLPPYPDQPSINPKLLATNDFWSPPTVHKIGDRVYSAVGFDLANSIMIEGDGGIIIVDTLSNYETAKEVMGEFRKITQKPVVAIIYTHGHLDHVHGTKAFLEEGENVEIYAHESHLDFYINENSVLGPIASIRSAHAAGSFLPEEGPDQSNMGVFPQPKSGTIAYSPPTQTFSDELDLEISGVKMKLTFVAGESSDQIYVWLPDEEVLLIGDNFYGIVPNIYTLRGAVYRDPMNYVHALDQMIPLEAEYLVPSHIKPIEGKENVRDVLVSTRDATQYIYDQTIRGMNNGYSPDELSRMIQLPENLDNHSFLTKARNDVSSHVKQIYYGNLGWFEGDSETLNEISLKERSKKIVDGFGGVDKSISSVREALRSGEYEWAAELGSYVLNVDEENKETKLLTAQALRVLAQRSEGADERNWLLTDALILEGKISITPDAFTQTSPEQMAELPIGKLLKALPTKIDPQKAKGMDLAVGVSYTDLDEYYTLHIRNSILVVSEELVENPDMVISLDSKTHKKIVAKQLDVLNAIDSGDLEFTGNRADLEKFFSLFDGLTISSQTLG